MRLGQLVVAALGASLAEAKCPRAENPSAALEQWFIDAANAFFPYREGWDVAYDQVYSRDLVASFNGTAHDFASFKAVYAAVYPVLSTRFRGKFSHGFLSIVGVPNAGDTGGFVTATGWEGGYVDDTDWLYNTTDAAFAVIKEQDDCSLRITEMRETSNLGFGAS